MDKEGKTLRTSIRNRMKKNWMDEEGGT